MSGKKEEKKNKKAKDKTVGRPSAAATFFCGLLLAVSLHVFVWSVFTTVYGFIGKVSDSESLHTVICLIGVLIYFVVRSNLISLEKVRTAGFFFSFHLTFVALLAAETFGSDLLCKYLKLPPEPVTMFVSGSSYEIALDIFSLCYLALIAVDFLLLVFDLYGKKHGNGDFRCFDVFSEEK